MPRGIPPSVLRLGFFLSGLVAPVVEELYFRASLTSAESQSQESGRLSVSMPPSTQFTISTRLGIISPFFLGFLPLAYYFKLRGNLLPTIMTHVLFNSVGLIVLLAGGSLPW